MRCAFSLAQGQVLIPFLHNVFAQISPHPTGLFFVSFFPLGMCGVLTCYVHLSIDRLPWGLCVAHCPIPIMQEGSLDIVNTEQVDGAECMRHVPVGRVGGWLARVLQE